MKPPSKKKQYRLILSAFILSLIFNFQSCMRVNPPSPAYNEPFIDVIIKHNANDIQASSIGIFDFGNSTKLPALGSDFAQLAKDNLLPKKCFQHIELIEKQADTLDSCIKIGRKQGYDLILVGYINHIFFGGITTHSDISISIRIIDVRNKNVLWYMNGYIEGQNEPSVDYIFFIKENKPAPFPSRMGGVLVNEMLNRIHL